MDIGGVSNFCLSQVTLLWILFYRSFLKRIFFFLMWAIFKVFIEFVIILFLLYVLFFFFLVVRHVRS